MDGVPDFAGASGGCVGAVSGLLQPTKVSRNDSDNPRILMVPKYNGNAYPACLDARCYPRTMPRMEFDTRLKRLGDRHPQEPPE
jgi:hypothetical protein